MTLNQEATLPQKNACQSKGDSFALALQDLAAIAILLFVSGCSDVSIDPQAIVANKKPNTLPPLNLPQSKEASTLLLSGVGFILTPTPVGDAIP